MYWKEIKEKHPNAYSEFISWIVFNTTLLEYLDFNEDLEEIPFEIYLGCLMIFFEETGIKIHCDMHTYTTYLTIFDVRSETFHNGGTLKECYDNAFSEAFYILDNSKKINP